MASEITLAIPNRNNERYLGQCLASVRLQKVRPTYVLLSDNHSSDGSAAVAEQFLDCIDEMVRPPMPLGYMEHLFWILDNVRTEWVIFSAGDDILHPDLISRYSELLSVSKDFTFLCSPFYSIDEHSRLMSKVAWPRSYDPGEMKDVFLRGPICNISSVAWNVRALAAVPKPPGQTGNCIDWYLYVYLSAHGRVGLVHEKLLYYRVYSSSTGNSDVRRHTRSCKEMFAWMRAGDLVPGFDRAAHDFLVSGFDEVLESTSAPRKPGYASFPARERWRHFRFMRKLERAITRRGS